MAKGKKKRMSKEEQASRKSRTEAKVAKGKAKAARREAKVAGGINDIDSILKDIEAKEAARTHVTIEDCSVPPPRANVTLTAVHGGDFLLFGGEYYDGLEATCYNDLYRWSIDNNVWKKIESPNTPAPRCSHQAVYHNGYLYIFAGEFATTEQFYHHKDLWRLDIKSNAWERLEPQGEGPSARSGHRMALWRGRLVVFGGFYEAFRETKWFQDLYVLDIQSMKWHQVTLSSTASQPSHRSGHCMFVHDKADELFVFGGYSKVHDDMWVLNLKPLITATGGTGTATLRWERINKRGAPPSKRIGSSMIVHKDRALLFGGVFDTEGPRTWYALGLKKKEQRRKGGMAKKKERAATGANEISNRSDGGDFPSKRNNDQDDGEDDEEEEEDYIDDYDEEASARNQTKAFVYVGANGKLIYVPHEDGDDGDNEWVECKEVINDEEEEKKDEMKEEMMGNEVLKCRDDDDQEDTNVDTVAAATVLNSGGGDDTCTALPLLISDNDGDAAAAQAEGEKEDDHHLEQDENSEWPLPRIRHALAVRGNIIYVFGGLLEIRDREYTLDDCWALDLRTREHWRNVLPGTMHKHIWRDDDEEMSSEVSSSMAASDEQSDIMEDSSEDEEDDMVDAAESRQRRWDDDDSKKCIEKQVKLSRKSTREEINDLNDRLNLNDIDCTPQMNELMNHFFSRTAKYWMTLDVENHHGTERATPEGRGGEFTEKEVRRRAFKLAEARYMELQPMLERLDILERQQREIEDARADKRDPGSQRRRGNAVRKKASAA